MTERKKYIGFLKSVDYFVNILSCFRKFRTTMIRVWSDAIARNSESFQASKWCTVASSRILPLGNGLCKRVDKFLFPTNVGREQARGWDEKLLVLESVIRVTRRCTSSDIRVNRASKMHGNGPGATAFSGNF